MRIPKGSKYIRIPKSIEGKSHQLFIFHGDELSEVISTSAEKDEGYYYYPVYSFKDTVSIKCSDERVLDSLAVII